MSHDVDAYAALQNYVSPYDHSSLVIQAEGLAGAGRIHQFLSGLDSDVPIPDFRDAGTLEEGGQTSLAMYDFEGARQVYRNFLSWMFRTFRVDETEFRNDLIRRLRVSDGAHVLITGCGNGDDVLAALDAVGPTGRVYASDLAPEMVVATHAALAEKGGDALARTSLSVCNAGSLPFENDFFDAAFHFGGINLFDDIKGAIHEMTRVTKEGRRVVFGDEGVAPWLANTEYGRMVIANNYLWAHHAPIDLLPHAAVDPSLSWVLGNCFYLIDFEKCSSGPVIDPDVPHVGRRGGTMRSRYYGQLEGVSPELKEVVLKVAAEQKTSVAEWLERAIRESIDRNPRKV
ncbi:methyltransferase domain-containing protein [Paraburkholderia madseniana]|uniref:Methyltransferase domain-containing protein n=1 Tax=Paraburkholderia madseniana TaxID=2599607 RepID=A0A6N6WF76_9BURK|nr:methyltransferase domain-containing protein [Paraburkholderia madseniana]KAE8759287.1 methyltransferase domain-containing protein [Paraburkholderia madseniana]